LFLNAHTMNSKSLISLLLFGLSFILADDVTVSWGLPSCGQSGFGLGFSAIDGGEAFKPDAKNGMMVPCDEWFEICFSFVDLQGNVINFPSLQASNFFSNIPGFINITAGVITATIQVENAGFGVGFISFTGATYVATGQPFTASCGTSQPNFRVMTNYFLTATNNNPTGVNYARALNQVTDDGPLGLGGVVAPYPNPTASFNIGQSMCNSVTGVDIRSFPFPSYGASLVALPPMSAGAVVPTSAAAATPASSAAVVTPASSAAAATIKNSAVAGPTYATPLPAVTPIIPQASQGQGGNGGLSGGGIAGIVICILVLVGAAAVAGYVWYRKRSSLYYQPERGNQPNQPYVAPIPVVAPTFVSKPLPASPPALFVGMPVMATYSVDGKQYRALIDQMRPGPQYLVRYVDFGNETEWLPAYSVRPM
jgi:hypothetical protein